MIRSPGLFVSYYQFILVQYLLWIFSHEWQTPVSGECNIIERPGI